MKDIYGDEDEAVKKNYVVVSVAGCWGDKVHESEDFKEAEDLFRQEVNRENVTINYPEERVDGHAPADWSVQLIVEYYDESGYYIGDELFEEEKIFPASEEAKND